MGFFKVCMFLVLSQFSNVMVNGECPLGWMHFQNSCYLFSNYKVTWFEASSSCHSHHADLVKVDSQEEETFLKHTARDTKNTHFWLGARDDIIEGTWMWSADDSVLSYTDWSTAEPNDEGGDEDCMELSGDHNWQWNDAPCRTFVISFICEKAYPGLKPGVIG